MLTLPDAIIAFKLTDRYRQILPGVRRSPIAPGRSLLRHERAIPRARTEWPRRVGPGRYLSNSVPAEHQGIRDDDRRHHSASQHVLARIRVCEYFVYANALLERRSQR